ncbi:hypothetical protein M405DRAFT_826879 [Rhizopogon salebrosus TDB-379]|nr:hypothetical protein M405DRAFT_826879 [Rhizopogon salebrosus TDB-379]
MSSPPQNLLPQVDLGNTFGALFIGVTLAAILFGVTNVQAFVYFQTHRGTWTLYKLAVIWLWVLDALHLALITHCVYYYLVTNYANFTALTEIVWSFKLQIVFDVLIVYGVHVLYAYRIWIVSKGRSRVLPTVVCIIVTLASGVVVAIIWAMYQCQVFADLITRVQWATYMVLGTTASVDFIIAASLCYLLATSRTGFSSTDSFLTKLMVYIVNTGSMTSASSMVAIITCAVMPTNFIFLCIEFLLAKLYVNSYLALLNARYYLQPGNSDTADISGLRAHRPSPHNRGSEEEKLQNSSKDVSRLPYDPYELYPTRPVQAVVPQQPIAVMMETGSFSSV